MSGPEPQQTPPDLREGVRAGILAGLERDAELRGGRTARRLGVAGAIGVLGAVGVTLLVSGHPYGHHPSWHAFFFGALWTGLLVVAVALVLLDVRTPSLPLAQAAAIAVIGLGLAGLCGAACPDQHFLHWWAATAAGSRLVQAGGPALAALCFGLVTALGFGAGAALLGPRAARGRMERPVLPAAMLVLLLAPGVALQSIGTSWAVFCGWLAGTAAGAYGGVRAGSWLRRIGRLAVAAALLLAACGGAPASDDSASGVVRGVDAGKAQITLEHAEVHGHRHRPALGDAGYFLPKAPASRSAPTRAAS